jgi:hypothetical protein
MAQERACRDTFVWRVEILFAKQKLSNYFVPTPDAEESSGK